MNTAAQTKPEPERNRVWTGSDAVVEALQQQGVEYVFGMIGGVIMPVFDALMRHGWPKHIIVGHEQGAAHMADGYARATGKPGVVMVTSGPGATNLVTGLANAMMDSVPMVALTGQVASSLIGMDAFQEADMWGLSMSITKHSYQVNNPEELGDVIADAFYLAASGRPGPVLIDLPSDVVQMPGPAPSPAKDPVRSTTPADPGQVALAMDMIARAQRPVILAGGGVINAEASDELRALAKTLGIPVALSLMGLGSFPSNDELCLGMIGMHGSGYANLAVHNSDLLVCVGTRLDDRITGLVEEWAPEAQLIHIDVDASEINKIVPSAVGMVSDAKEALTAMAASAGKMSPQPDYSAWRQRIAELRKEHPLTYPESGRHIMPQRVVEAVGAKLSPEALVVTGVGQHQMFTAQYYPFRTPRSLITSGGLGTMGFGLPAALGAKMGRPDRDVVCLDGDGSFLMNIQELTTAVRYGIGVVVVIMNNGYLGMVRQWQDLMLEGRHSGTVLAPPPFDKVAQSFGALGRRVERGEDLGPALDWALAQARHRSLPVVLDVIVDPEAMVLPMVPSGTANKDFIPCRPKEA